MIRKANSMAEAKTLLEAHPQSVLLDVREDSEYATGHLDWAECLPVDSIDAETAAEFIPEKTAEVMVYCRSGARSALAARRLERLGYTDIIDLGGLAGWPYKMV